MSEAPVGTASADPATRSVGAAAARHGTADVRLGAALAVDCDFELARPDGPGLCVRAHVRLPDDARALLEALSWGGARTIVDTVSAIGAAYAARCVDARQLDPSAASPLAVAFDMPLDEFRRGLDAVRATTPADRRSA